MFIVMKKFAIALSIFPGSLFIIALLNYAFFAFVERNIAPSGVNIGLSLLLLAALINVPTIISWVVFFIRKRGEEPKTTVGGDASRGKGLMQVAVYLVPALVIVTLSAVMITEFARAKDAPDANRVSSIGEWEARTQLPGFSLLNRADLPSYYVCVYDTGSGEIAFCFNEKKPGSADIHSFGVYDSEGNNLQDPARWNKHSDLNTHGKAYIIKGMVVPVRPGYSGIIRIEFRENRGSGFKSVYTKLLPYNSNSEQGGAGQPATRAESK